MLDLDLQITAIDDYWTSLPRRAALPGSWAQYSSRHGAIRNKTESRRRYCRVGLCGIAVILAQDEAYAGYVKDVSKIGVGFYSPVSLLPRASIKLWLPGHPRLPVNIRRCRRTQDLCFECGGLFDLSETT